MDLRNNYLDIRSESSSVGTVLALKHSARHSVEVFDVKSSEVDFVAAVTAVGAAAVESPHDVADFETVIVSVLLNQFVAVDLNNASRVLLINYSNCLLFYLLKIKNQKKKLLKILLCNCVQFNKLIIMGWKNYLFSGIYFGEFSIRAYHSLVCVPLIVVVLDLCLDHAKPVDSMELHQCLLRIE